MTLFRKVVLAASLMALASVAVPLLWAQGADESNWPVVMTFSQSFQIGTHVFSPGRYFFQLSPGTWARSVVMVYNLDKGCWEGMFNGVNVNRSDAYISHGFRTDRRIGSGFTFENRGGYDPEALRYWFYPGWERGVKFIDSPAQSAGNSASFADVAEAKTPASK
jgi:hypothetical protein